MTDGSCVVLSVQADHTEQTFKYKNRNISHQIICTNTDMAIGQTKALVVNDKTQTAVSCCGHLCTLGVLRWDGTDTHHTEARAQRFKSSYDVILEGENNKHFVTTKQCTVLAQTQHTTKPFLGCHLDRKQHIKVKQVKLSVRNMAQDRIWQG